MLRLIAVLGVLLALPGVAYAGSIPVPVVDVHWDDYRAIGEGLEHEGGVGPAQNKLGDLKVSWLIDELSPGIWSYKFEFSTTDDDPIGISHFTLELSENFTLDNILEISEDSAPLELDDGEPESPRPITEQGTQKTVFGLKFEENSDFSKVEFVADRSPVWGDFIVKKGQDYAWNSGFGEDPPVGTGMLPFLSDRTNYIDWIPTPDTFPEPPTIPIPMPSAAGGFLCFVVGLGLTRLRRRRRPAHDSV